MTIEFAAMVTGTHPDAKAYREYVLAELRCARRRAQLLMLEIETIGVALVGNVIEPDTAIAWLADANALEFLRPTEPGAEPKGEAEKC